MFSFASSIFRAPRLFSRRGRGVALGLAWGTSTAALLAPAGCSSPPPLVTGANLKASTSELGRNAARPVAGKSGSGAKAGSLDAALSKIDAATVQAWLARWTEPPGTSSAPRAPEVRIDVEILARHHPAWQLAAALERGAVSPAEAQIAPLVALSQAPSFLTSPAALHQALHQALAVRPATILRVPGAGSSVRNRENAALSDFLAAARARDALRGRDETFLSRRSLADAVAATRRGTVGDLDLALIPPEVALELTNLRLKLLRNLAKTPAQREAARAEIRVIEARYAEIWRQQTALQAARVRQLTQDLPAQQEREGLTSIARETEAQTRRRAAARREVARGLQNRLAADFARQNDDLTLPLPATSVVPMVKAATSNLAPRRAQTQFFETSPDLMASSGALDAKSRSAKSRLLATPRRFDAALIARLRSEARGEAAQWATLLAAQWGTRWSDKTGLPNRTGAAVQALFGEKAAPIDSKTAPQPG